MIPGMQPSFGFIGCGVRQRASVLAGELRDCGCPLEGRRECEAIGDADAALLRDERAYPRLAGRGPQRASLCAAEEAAAAGRAERVALTLSILRRVGGVEQVGSTRFRLAPSRPRPEVEAALAGLPPFIGVELAGEEE